MADQTICETCGSELEPERSRPNQSGFGSRGAASGVRTILKHRPPCGERPAGGSTAVISAHNRQDLILHEYA
jgi:hypothetical protein